MIPASRSVAVVVLNWNQEQDTADCRVSSRAWPVLILSIPSNPRMGSLGKRSAPSIGTGAGLW